MMLQSALICVSVHVFFSLKYPPACFVYTLIVHRILQLFLTYLCKICSSGKCVLS